MMRAAVKSEPDSGYERLEAQIDWYDRKSGSNQSSYKLGRLFVLAASASIPILALNDYTNLVAALGALIALVEGGQHLYQWQHNWITYRSTCEALRHEKYCYIERADPYDTDDDRAARKLLVERVESLISTEHSKWIASQEKAAESGPKVDARSSRSPN
jgi:hypothetical protein